MNREERFALYDTIGKWLKYSPYKTEQQLAIFALLGSLKQCELSKKEYDRHMRIFKSKIEENEETEDENKSSSS